jgi:DNA uptake protein ComE-like DNA-binding protein
MMTGFSRIVHDEQGFALVLVLWLCLVLASVALCFGHVVLLGHRSGDAVRGTLQCRQTVRSAVPYVAALLKTAENGAMPELDSEDTEAVVVGASGLWLVAPVWNESPEMGYGVVSEAGKLNLNTATKDMLQILPGVTEAIAAAIIDWRDEDSDPESYGAEDETYSRKDPPYRARNGKFTSVEELLLVDGVTEELLYGKDRNQNGEIDPWEGDGSGRDLTDFGIYHLVTVYSSEPATSGESGSESVDVTDSRALAAYVRQQVGVEVSGTFRSVLEFAAKGGLTREQFAGIEGKLVASGDEAAEGLVNVKEAPYAVLRCLPGVGDDGAGKLVSYRVSNPEELTSIAWILDVLGDDCAAELGPHVTLRTYQVSADVVAVADYRRAVRRTRLVFDLSSGSPQLVAQRDLSGMAWPLGEEVWNELKTRTVAGLAD